MKINITIVDGSKDYNYMYEEIGSPIHNSLSGNKDYVDSNVVLNFDGCIEEPECNLDIYTDECSDLEMARLNAKKLIDLYFDNLINDEKGGKQ